MENFANESPKESNACRLGEMHDFFNTRLVRDVPESGVFSLPDCFAGVEEELILSPKLPAEMMCLYVLFTENIRKKTQI